MARRRYLVQRRRRYKLEGHPPYKRKDGRLGRQRSSLRKDDWLDWRTATLYRYVCSNLVARLRPWYAIRGHQTSEPAGQSERRLGLETENDAYRLPPGPQLEPW